MATTLPTTGIQAAAPSANTARVLIGRVQESVKLALDQQRPWHELVDKNSFAKPENLTDATNRVKKNLSYFRVNYGTAILAVVVISMLLSPSSIFWLFVLGLLWGYVFTVRTEPIVISGRTLSEQEKFWALTAISILVTFGLTQVGSILMSGVIIGTAVVVAHAALRVPDDLFLDEPDSGTFISWLTGTHQAIPTQLPPSVARV